MESKWVKEKAYLEQAILVDKLSYEEIGGHYNCTGSNIKKVALKLGIELPVKRKVNPCETFTKEKLTHTCLNCGKNFEHKIHCSNKYCCSECEKEYKHKKKYELILKGDPSIMRANYSPQIFKKDIMREQGNVCSICGLSPLWNGKELVFILDHIDGHASNNKRDNLRCICPNCDSQLDTYKSKNKCGERSYYRYHKEDAENKIGK